MTILSSVMIVNAATQATFTVSNASGAAGSDVPVSVSITKDSGMAAATFVVTYDNTKLECVSADPGKALTTGMNDINVDASKGTVTLVYINEDVFNDAGEILNINFKIKDDASGEVPVTLNVKELVDITYANLSSSVNQGKIQVLSSGTATVYNALKIAAVIVIVMALAGAAFLLIRRKKNLGKDETDTSKEENDAKPQNDTEDEIEDDEKDE